MGRILMGSAVGLIVVLCVSQLQATDYYWNYDGTTGTNHGSTDYWNNSDNWMDVDNNPVADYPHLPTDRAFFSTCSSGRAARLADGDNIDCGLIDFRGTGSTVCSVAWNAADNVRIATDNSAGLGGDMIYYNAYTYNAGDNNGIFIDGNLVFNGGSSTRIPVTMYGKDVYYSPQPNTNRNQNFDLIVDGGVVYDNLPNAPNHFDLHSIILRNGAVLAPGVDYGANDYWFDLKDELIVENGTVNASIRFQCQGAENNTYIQGDIPGIEFGRDLRLATSYSGSNPTDDSWFERTVRGGDLIVDRNLIFQHQSGVRAASYRLTLNLDDNGIARALHVKGDLEIGYVSSSRVGDLLMCGSSQVDVDGSVYVSGTGYRTNDNSGYGTGAIDMGSAIIRVGGDWQNNRRFDTSAHAYDPTRYIETAWNSGTSTVIFDGNGGSPTQTFYPDNLPFHSIIIDTLGTVQLYQSTSTRSLQDVLRLTGDLWVKSGTFTQGNKSITFAGSSAQMLQDDVGTAFTQLLLAPSALVKLGSDIAADNVVLALKSQVWLNGNTLDANGETYTSGPVCYHSGEGLIYGATPGDANYDGKIDGGDLAIWQQHYDPLGLNANDTFAVGDFDCNGKIDGGDLAVWQQNYNPLGIGGVGAGTSVPEPTTLLLLGTGLLGALGILRRRRG